MLLPIKKSPLEKLTYITNENKKITLWVKREDLLHQHISGNKYRKLKYNVEEARAKGYDTLLTFGGAYSNHIAATAAAGNELGFKTIGIIRGDELAIDEEDTIKNNPTLCFAKSQGMQFKFVDRKSYRQKHTQEFISSLKKEFGKFYLVPEGGTNELAVKGCEEILGDNEKKFNYICAAIGTGGTISGIINSLEPNQKVIGFPALKGDFHKKEIAKYVGDKLNWELNLDYHFGGFARINEKLVNFINDFKNQTGLQLDPIYTGKMVYGIVDMYNKGFFSDADKVLAIHSGGLQGIDGMNYRLKNRGIPLINFDNEKKSTFYNRCI